MARDLASELRGQPRRSPFTLHDPAGKCYGAIMTPAEIIHLCNMINLAMAGAFAVFLVVFFTYTVVTVRREDRGHARCRAPLP